MHAAPEKTRLAVHLVAGKRAVAAPHAEFHVHHEKVRPVHEARVDKRVLRRGRGVQQESTFWRRSLWERAGGRLDTSFPLAADLDLWARFWRHAKLYGVAVPLAGIRRHSGQRHITHIDRYMAEAAVIARQYGVTLVRGGRESTMASLRHAIAERFPRRWRSRLHGLGLYRKGLVVQQRNREGRWTVGTVYFP